MRFENPTKWEYFLDGFRNILYILDCYDDGDEWGYDEFWESLNLVGIVTGKQIGRAHV